MTFELHASAAEEGLVRDSALGSTTVGLDGLLADRGHRARRVRVPGTDVAEGFRWRLRDVWSQTWWPQGIAVGDHGGVPVAVTSWYAQPRRGIEMGARISVVNLSDPRRPRYHHVLLVSPRRLDGGIGFDPVRVHAGGIVWAGDRLFVAATRGGIREFRLSDIMRTPSRGVLRRGSGPFGYRYLLPESGGFTPQTEQKGRMRYSFIALEHGASDAGGDIRLVGGEYSTGERARLARMRVLDGGTVIDESHVPAIPQMQGAVLHDGTWFVTASRGDKLGGDLWVGTPGGMVRREHALPPGPEDLAVWPERRQLWSVTEFPGKRWVFAVDLDQPRDTRDESRSRSASTSS
jgi:hypothetical protein